jgi:S1-C subfamily serine protease
MKEIFAAVMLTVLVVAVASAQSFRTPDEQNTIAVFEKARQGIVHIKVSQHKTEPFGSETAAEGMGSGFLIDRQGHILTNYHVIGTSNRVDIYLPSGREAAARVVGTAPSLDIALLNVDLEPDDSVEPLPLGDSDTLQVGQKVVAVGHPLALHNTLTVGVLSALGRSLPEGPVELEGVLLQTDAAINPGSSGGPLLSSGEVIGIATAMAPGAQNVGFAVPINLVKRVIPDLVRMGHPYRPSLGIEGTEITPELATLFGLDRDTGFLVERVAPGSLAQRAGLRAGRRVVLLHETAYVLGGDIIASINGQQVSKASHIARILLQSRPGDLLLLTILREGKLQEVALTLGEMHGR